MAMPLRPQHFLSRENGSLTALIAVDELPPFVSIRGIPRTLSHNDTQGMTSLGTVNSRGQFYFIDNSAQVSPHPNGKHGAESAKNNMDFLPSGVKSGQDGDFHQISLLSTGQDISPGWEHDPQGYDVQAWKNQNGNGQELIKHNSGHRHGNPGKGSQNSNATKKEFCSFWLRHGECDYQQQGCIFKHEMPTDRSTLEKLGLRDIPRWYREKHGVKGFSGGGPVTGGGSHNGAARARSDAGRFWRNDSQQQATAQGERYDIPSTRLIMAGTSDERVGTTGMSTQYSSSASPTAGGQGDYRSVPRPPSNMTTVANSSSSGNTNAIIGPLDPSRMGNRFEYLTVDQISDYSIAEPTPISQNGFRNPPSNPGAHGKSKQVDYLTTSGADATGSQSNQHDQPFNETGSNNVKNHSRGHAPNSLWTLRENTDDDLSILPLTPFQTVGTMVTQRPVDEQPQAKKKARSRRLYQPRPYRAGNEGRNGTAATTSVENMGENNVQLRSFTATPVTAPYPLDPISTSKTSETNSPCFSPLPSGSYASSICSPRSVATTSRLSCITDNFDNRRKDMAANNKAYGNNYEPGSAHTEVHDTNTAGDLFGLNLNDDNSPRGRDP